MTRRLPADTWAMLAVAGAVLLANILYLLDVFVANPLGPRSGLLSGLSPGPLPGAPVLDPNNGVISQALGHRAVLDWLHAQLPWWNSYAGTGMPLAGEMQSAALFPPTFLTLLSNGQLYEHILLELTAGISTCLLLRRVPLGSFASAIGGIAFALNGTFAWFGHATVNPVAFLPMLLLGIELAFAAARDGRPGGWWLIAVAGALSFYAGFPEVAYIDALLAASWFAWRAACVGRERLWPFTAKAFAGAAVGALLAAPLMIAMVGYFNHADLELHATDFVSSLHLAPHGLPQLLLPYVYGPIYAFADSNWGIVGGYLSASLLALGLLGLFSGDRHGLRLILLGWIVLALARIYDQPHILGELLGVLPGMPRVEFARYAFAALELPVIVLAALGVEALLGGRLSRQRSLWCALAALAVMVLAALAARPVADRLGSTSYYAASVAVGTGIVIAIGGVALARRVAVRTWLLGALVIGEVVALFGVPEFSAPRSVRTDLAPVAYLRRHLGLGRFVSLGPLQPNYGSYFGTASLNLSDGAVPPAYADYVRSRLDPVVAPTIFVGKRNAARLLFAPTTPQDLLKHLRAYRAAGVTYALTPSVYALPQSPKTFRLVLQSPSTRIYRLAGAVPYFSSPGCAVRANSRESVKLSCPDPTVLVRLETELPGWSAQVDGHSALVQRVDGLFQAVAVPAGSHRLTFSYAPGGIGWGLAALAASCAWLLLAPVLGRPRLLVRSPRR